MSETARESPRSLDEARAAYEIAREEYDAAEALCESLARATVNASRLRERAEARLRDVLYDAQLALDAAREVERAKEI